MGIDKMRLTSNERPREGFEERIEKRLFREEHAFLRRKEMRWQGELDRGTITFSTPKRFEPSLYLKVRRGSSQQMHCEVVLEINPNQLPQGLETLKGLIRDLFLGEARDMRIVRLDLNAEIDLSVDYCFRTLRVSRKRVFKRYGESDRLPLLIAANLGISGFEIGKSPAKLVVYDKGGLLGRMENGRGNLPKTLTRLEWQLRGAALPITRLSQIAKLLKVEPFSDLSFLECSEEYDFRSNSRASLRRYNLNRLTEDYGRHEAVRILNRNGNFTRDFTQLLVARQGILERLQASYLDGVKLFLSNKQAHLMIAKN